MHQQNNIGAAIFIKHFQKHYINQLSSLEEYKIKNKDESVQDLEKSLSKLNDFQNNSSNQRNIEREDSLSAVNSLNRYENSKENILKNTQDTKFENEIEIKDNRQPQQSYDKNEYNISNMTENQLKYANNLIERIKKPKSDIEK